MIKMKNESRKANEWKEKQRNWRDVKKEEDKLEEQERGLEAKCVSVCV